MKKNKKNVDVFFVFLKSSVTNLNIICTLHPKGLAGWPYTVF